MPQNDPATELDPGKMDNCVNALWVLVFPAAISFIWSVWHVLVKVGDFFVLPCRIGNFS